LALTCLRFNPEMAESSPAAFYSLAGGAFAAFVATLWFVVRPWSPHRIGLRAGLLMLCAYAGLALSGASQHAAGPTENYRTVLTLIIGALAFQGASILLIWLFVNQHGLSLREGFGLAKDKRRSMLLGATIALAFIPVALGLQFGIGMIAEFFNFHLPTQSAVQILRLADSWADRIAVGLVVAVLAPVAEEGLFRGILYPAVKSLGYPGAAMWISSAAFAVIHLNALSFLPLFVLAVLLVKLYEKTGNLLSCIACHATFNLFNFIMLFATHQISESAPGQP